MQLDMDFGILLLEIIRGEIVKQEKYEKALELYHRWRVLKYTIDHIAKILENPGLISKTKAKMYLKRCKDLEKEVEKLKSETHEFIKEVKENG